MNVKTEAHSYQYSFIFMEVFLLEFSSIAMQKSCAERFLHQSGHYSLSSPSLSISISSSNSSSLKKSSSISKSSGVHG